MKHLHEDKQAHRALKTQQLNLEPHIFSTLVLKKRAWASLHVFKSMVLIELLISYCSFLPIAAWYDHHRVFSSLLNDLFFFLMFWQGGYDENDVRFVWLRGNDSVHGLENLRLSQYTVVHFCTLVTRTHQETGNKSAVEIKTVWRARFMSDLTIFSALITPEAFSDESSASKVSARYPVKIICSAFTLDTTLYYYHVTRTFGVIWCLVRSSTLFPSLKEQYKNILYFFSFLDQAFIQD